MRKYISQFDIPINEALYGSSIPPRKMSAVSVYYEKCPLLCLIKQFALAIIREHLKKIEMYES